MIIRRRVSVSAEMFSIFPWPYGCSLSAGFSDARTAKKVTSVARRSRKEWSASERIPRLPVSIPITSLPSVNNPEATADKNAMVSFSLNPVFLSGKAVLFTTVFYCVIM